MLHTTDLRVAFRETTVLDGVTIPDCQPGTITGLLGPNGAGKSTLLKTITGIERSSSGTVCVDPEGEPLTGRRLRDAIGYVPQDLLSTAVLTVFESVLLSQRCGRTGRSRATLEAAAAALEQLELTHLAHRPVHQLSGGQRQLVSVAQVLVRRPPIVLLDEPTSALDVRHQVELLNIVRNDVVSRSACALIAIHDLNLAARFCDRLIVLNGGKICADGTPRDVLTPDTLENVYGFRARVLDDDGVPVICPVAA